MPLEPPVLDRRTHAELVEGLRLRAQRFVPEWTDFNESEPGTTLVELFAWLSDMLFYELNRVPDVSYLKFLQLVGLELRTAQPARADLEFVPRPGAEIGPVPAGAQVGAQPPGGGQLLVFETEASLDLTGVPLAAVQVFDGAGFTVRTPENLAPQVAYRPFGVGAPPGSALYLGFAAPPAAAPAPPFPAELRFRVFRPQTAEGRRAERCETAAAAQEPPVSLVWEYLPRAGARWRRLDDFGDESVAFTREGYVAVRGPREIEPVQQGKVPEPHLWLRARVAGGSYPSGTEPEIDFIRANVVPASNLATVRAELVGTSNGRPNQTFALQRRPVAAGTLELDVNEPEEEKPRWEPADDLLAAKANDKHYVLNANTGELRFGDGVHGRIPLAGSEVVAQVYRFGGGAAGNVSADLITTPITTLTGVDTVSNPRPAVGGADEQDVEDLKARAPGAIRRSNRAVTEEDFASLAAEVGGVARATALALHHPAHPGVEVPGAVTVVVLPVSGDPQPEPSPDLRRAVCRYLERYRLITTELFVTGPAYSEILVETRLSVRPYAAAGDVKRDVERRLEEAIDPRTREFGADLHPTSLYAVILDSPDVVSVDSLAVKVDGNPHDVRKPVEIGSGGLPSLVGRSVVTTPARDR
jgi:predicted phage baseplate assembly protein